MLGELLRRRMDNEYRGHKFLDGILKLVAGAVLWFVPRLPDP